MPTMSNTLNTAISHAKPGSLPGSAQPARSMVYRCTFTGVDELTSLTELAVLSRTYRQAEWAFLYSPFKAGQEDGRYPSLAFILEALAQLPRGVPTAVHFCGSSVRMLLQADPEMQNLAHAVFSRGGRIQLNFSHLRGDVAPASIKYFVAHAQGPVILQHNSANAPLISRIEDMPNLHVLFDASGGQGLTPADWPDALSLAPCGYAGGLNAYNLAEELDRIRTAGQGRPIWIDMESSLRMPSADGSDRFDLARCVQVMRRLAHLLSST